MQCVAAASPVTSQVHRGCDIDMEQTFVSAWMCLCFVYSYVHAAFERAVRGTEELLYTAGKSIPGCCHVLQALLEEWRNELARKPLVMSEREACAVLGVQQEEGGQSQDGHLSEDALKAAYRSAASATGHC